MNWLFNGVFEEECGFCSCPADCAVHKDKR